MGETTFCAVQFRLFYYTHLVGSDLSCLRVGRYLLKMEGKKCFYLNFSVVDKVNFKPYHISQVVFIQKCYVVVIIMNDGLRYYPYLWWTCIADAFLPRDWTMVLIPLCNGNRRWATRKPPDLLIFTVKHNAYFLSVTYDSVSLLRKVNLPVLITTHMKFYK